MPSFFQKWTVLFFCFFVGIEVAIDFEFISVLISMISD